MYKPLQNHPSTFWDLALVGAKHETRKTNDAIKKKVRNFFISNIN